MSTSQDIAEVIWNMNEWVDEKDSIKNNPANSANVLKDSPTTFEKNVYSPESIKKISSTITESLKGVDPQGRDIVVGDNVIRSVLNTIIESHIPRSGDIYSKYQIMYNDPNNSASDIIAKTIEVITYTTRNEIEMIKNNNKLSVWDNLFGDFNKHGLRAHPNIKLKERHPDYMLFNMRY
jgi:hypothetical protein